MPTQLLRDVRHEIDQKDLRIYLLENRVAERDSIISSRDQEWEARLAYWQEYAEDVSSGLLDRLVYAIVLAVGVWLGVEAGG